MSGFEVGGCGDAQEARINTIAPPTPTQPPTHQESYKYTLKWEKVKEVGLGPGIVHKGSYIKEYFCV